MFVKQAIRRAFPETVTCIHCFHTQLEANDEIITTMTEILTITLNDELLEGYTVDDSEERYVKKQHANQLFNQYLLVAWHYNKNHARNKIQLYCLVNFKARCASTKTDMLTFLGPSWISV